MILKLLLYVLFCLGGMFLKFCWISGHTNINMAQTKSNSKYVIVKN